MNINEAQKDVSDKLTARNTAFALLTEAQGGFSRYTVLLTALILALIYIGDAIRLRN